MSDSSPFGDFQSDPQSAQDFTGDDDGGAPIALGPPTDDNVFDDQPAPSHDAPAEEDAFGLSSPPPAAAASAEDEEGGDADVDPFATVDGGSSANAGAFDSFSNNPPEAKEEQQEALALWEKERAVVLRERAAKAEADKAALLAQAKDEMNKFYADREAQLAKAQKTNRADEKNYRADMKSTFESGARWEKVNKLISTQPKANEKAGQSRVDRMRKLLIQLKAEKKQ